MAWFAAVGGWKKMMGESCWVGKAKYYLKLFSQATHNYPSLFFFLFSSFLCTFSFFPFYYFLLSLFLFIFYLFPPSWFDYLFSFFCSPLLPLFPNLFFFSPYLSVYISSISFLPLDMTAFSSHRLLLPFLFSLLFLIFLTFWFFSYSPH